MMQIVLRSDSDSAALDDLIRQSLGAKQRDRLRAVQLTIAGESTLAIMAMLGRSRGFVQRWCDACRDGGYIFGAVAPRTGQSSALIAPTVNTQLMSTHLRMIAQEAGDDVHVVLVLDGAGWHKAKDWQVPHSMTLLFLPPYSPELMPMERVWQWMRHHDPSNRIFADEGDIDQATMASWNKLTRERLKSITATDWLTHAI